MARALLRTRGMLTFDLAELKTEGVVLETLPDERGRIIDGRELPAAFAKQLLRNGVDTSKPLRIVGVITRRAGGEPGPYRIWFEQA